MVQARLQVSSFPHGISASVEVRPKPQIMDGAGGGGGHRVGTCSLPKTLRLRGEEMGFEFYLPLSCPPPHPQALGLAAHFNGSSSLVSE